MILKAYIFKHLFLSKIAVKGNIIFANVNNLHPTAISSYNPSQLKLYFSIN